MHALVIFYVLFEHHAHVVAALSFVAVREFLEFDLGRLIYAGIYFFC